MSGWTNQNTKKQVFTFSRPLAEEKAVMAAIPKNAVVTSVEKNTKNIKVTYVIDKSFTMNDIVGANQMTVKPIKLERIGGEKKLSTTKFKQVKRGKKVMALVNVADFHLNRLVFGDETYGKNYNLDIASEVFMRTIDEIVDRLRNNPYTVDKIVFNTCGDFLNSDTIAGTTTAGTRQVDDVTWKKAFARATALLEHAMLECSKVADVEYLYIRGNHDEQVGFYLTSWLAARFMNVKNIKIYDSPKPRQILEYGTNLIVLAHGETEGVRTPDLPLIEPGASNKFSSSTNVEVISGHLHKEQILTKYAVKWEVLSSACPVQDDWSYGKAFSNYRSQASINFYDSETRVQQDFISTDKILREIEAEIA